MDDKDRLHYESQSQTLRTELKKWENDWARDQGKKPSRNDIKQNPDIAQKYKLYNKTRDILSGKLPPPSNPRKRRPSGPPATQTPSKRSRPAETPVKEQWRDAAAAEAVTPSLSRKLFSPAAPTSIGPTPQRDGRVLGLFDLLSSDADTPSRPRTTAEPVRATPRKQTAGPGGPATPLRDRDGNARRLAAGGTGISFAARVGLEPKTTPRGPESASKLVQFATPSFLKRTTSVPLPSVDENGEYVEAPRPLRLPRKPFVRRGLSSIVAGLRKLEEEKLDDDLDVLREMEMMEAGGLARGDGKIKAGEERRDSTVEVFDSQPPALLGGFDDEGLYDSPDEEAAGLGRDGKPLRVFKKKGQKRTTRLVKMKPTRAKRPALPVAGEEEEAIPETQIGDGATPADESNPLEPGSDSEFDGGPDGESEEESADRRSKTKNTKETKTKKAKGTKEKTKAADKAGDKEAGGEGVVQRAARKVKATANANFKRLKLRNNGSKGGPGYNSRFRRRR